MATGKLTDAGITTLQREAEQTGAAVYYWDTELKGLGVRVSTQGQVSWLYRYFLGATSKRLTFVAKDTKDARLQAMGFKVEVSKGVDLLDRKAAAHRQQVLKMGGQTVDQAMEKYLATRDDGTRYWHEVKLEFKKVQGVIGKDRLIAVVTKQDIRNVINRKQELRQFAMARYTYTALKPFFDWCVEQDLLVVSPIADLSRPAPSVSRDRVLSDRELVTFWDATAMTWKDSRGGWRWCPLYRLLLLTAQRRDEVAGMAWTELDLLERTWTIPKERTKNGVAHIVHLSPMAMDIISTIPKHPQSQLLFKGRSGNPISGFSKAKEWLDHSMRVLEPWVIHDLRRTAATGMAKIGIPPHITERVLNHTSGSKAGIQGVYQRYEYLEDRKVAMDKWGVYVNDLVNSS